MFHADETYHQLPRHDALIESLDMPAKAWQMECALIVPCSALSNCNPWEQGIRWFEDFLKEVKGKAWALHAHAIFDRLGLGPCAPRFDARVAQSFNNSSGTLLSSLAIGIPYGGVLFPYSKPQS